MAAYFVKHMLLIIQVFNFHKDNTKFIACWVYWNATEFDILMYLYLQNSKFSFWISVFINRIDCKFGVGLSSVIISIIYNLISKHRLLWYRSPYLFRPWLPEKRKNNESLFLDCRLGLKFKCVYYSDYFNDNYSLVYIQFY